MGPDGIRAVHGLHLGSGANALGVKIYLVSVLPLIELIPKSILLAVDISHA